MDKKTFISSSRFYNKIIVVVIGMLFLIGSSGTIQKICLDMSMPNPISQHSEMPDCPTKHGDKQLPDDLRDHCDSMINCDCSFEVNSIKEQTVLISKVEISQPDLVVVEILITDQTDKDFYSYLHPEFYSSPPLFLTNETFLI
ncbi:hypothetical protein [Gracilimonas sediminicola]|uniref:Uncharacterized protein n=1 Tax=Gracilimonas sediminicola TaxID=2952158 RepID=A0A9X2RFV0_9BACT|nr:hypothetical protein [Gracilimonas sediminicola]MCP9290564.1 hypothetical protein [Gracilimonas sediminicola]